MPFGSNTLVTCNPPYKAPGAGIKNPDGVQLGYDDIVPDGSVIEVTYEGKVLDSLTLIIAE